MPHFHLRGYLRDTYEPTSRIIEADNEDQAIKGAEIIIESIHRVAGSAEVKDQETLPAKNQKPSRRYLLKGKHRHTGGQIELSVLASCIENATALGEEAGIDVDSIVIQPNPPSLTSETDLHITHSVLSPASKAKVAGTVGRIALKAEEATASLRERVSRLKIRAKRTLLFFALFLVAAGIIAFILSGVNARQKENADRRAMNFAQAKHDIGREYAHSHLVIQNQSVKYQFGAYIVSYDLLNSGDASLSAVTLNVVFFSADGNEVARSNMYSTTRLMLAGHVMRIQDMRLDETSTVPRERVARIEVQPITVEFRSGMQLEILRRAAELNDEDGL